MRITARASFWILLSCLLLPAARAATIEGHVFTAENDDSLAVGAPVTLIFRNAANELQHVKATSDNQGHFRYLDLPPDTSVAYVLQIAFRGREFLSAPIHFAPDNQDVDFNVLLSDKAPPEGELPAGHPQIANKPEEGTPVRPNALHTILIVLCIVLVFSGFAHLSRRARGEAGGGDLSPPARSLARDIASLDLRYADGVIGEDEYRKVRAGLIDRLRAMRGVSGR